MSNRQAASLPDRQSFLLALTDSLRPLSEPLAVMHTAIEQVGHYLQINRIGFCEVDDTCANLTYVCGWTDGSLEPLAGVQTTSLFGADLLAIFVAGETVVIHDFDRDPRVSSGAIAALGFRATVGIPLLRDGRWVAGLFTHQVEPRGWTTDEVVILQDVLERTWDVVERVRVERDLRASEARLRLAIEAGQIGEWELDVGADSSVRAPRHDHIFGHDVPVAHWGFDTFIDHVLPEDRPSVEAAFAQTSKQGSGWNFECRIRRANDGQVRWITARSTPQRDAAGRALKLFGIVQDITDQKFAEERLRQSNEMLERRVEEVVAERNQAWRLSQDLLAITDIEGRYTAVNLAWTTILGWEPEHLIGVAFTDFIHPADLQGAVDAYLSVMRQPLSNAFDCRLRHKDGSYRWLAWTAVLEGGQMYANGRDVTIERESIDALKQSEARARLFLDLSPEYLLMVRVEPDGRVVFEGINPAAESVFGRSNATIVDRDVADVVPQDSARAISDYARLCLSTGEIQSYQAERAYSAENPVLIDAVVAPMQRSLSGDGSGLVLFSGRDITEKRRLEDQLRQSQKMEAVGQLTGGLAHDFNNLLTGVTGSLDMMQTRLRQGRYQDVERYVSSAQGAAARAAALTHRLLAFSRRQTLAPKPTDANRLITELVDLIRRTVGPAINVEMVGLGGLWSTLVDPGQLENALLNLCINARDAMPDGGMITIETSNRWLDERGARESDVPPGQYVSLCVSDTGTGMPPEVIARAFDPFFTTKPIGQGTGLGLSMIYGFARQSGGYARIYSEVGAGTAVRLYLPRHLGTEDRVGALPDLSDAPRAERGETVLVVDDEPTVRMLVSDVLEELGYSAIEAADGAAGLKVLQSNVRIDLLVTDVGLPGGMNGRQVADAARVARPELKVLFITGYAENAVLSHGHLDPGMHVMTKPFAMEALASRIKDLIVC